jgi:lipopolysaccharide assembly protein A
LASLGFDDEVKREDDKVRQGTMRGGIIMQFFFWLAFLVVVVLAVFAIQNSMAPAVTMTFLVWQFETSLVYVILGAIGSGMLIILLLWIPSAIRASLRTKKLVREVEVLQREMRRRMEGTQPKEP